MTHTGSVKVPDGKLVEVTLTGEERIESARLTGDFFLEPPEARTELEAAIEGHPVAVDREALLDSIEPVEAQCIGFGPADLADAVLEAVR